MYKSPSNSRLFASTHKLHKNNQRTLSSWWKKWWHYSQSILWFVRHNFKSVRSFLQAHSMVSLVAKFLSSWLYVGLVYMMYLLRGWQLWVFVVLWWVLIWAYFFSVMLPTVRSRWWDHLWWSMSDVLKLMCVVVIVLCAYDQTVYRTGIMRFVLALLMAYVMIIFFRQSPLFVAIGIWLGVVIYMLLSWLVLSSLTR
jgi:hypothetical protein